MATTPQKDPPGKRRERALARLERERATLSREWYDLESRLYVQERRVAGITRGFRAVLPLGAAAGAMWLLRRFGPARVVRQAMFALTAWRALRRYLPNRFAWHQERSL